MLRTKITESLKDAMRAKNEASVAAIRLIISEMRKRDIDARANGNMDGISENELLSLLQGMVKQRRESIELYEKGNRKDLADKERNEISVIENFLPKALGDDEVTHAIQKIIADVGAKDIKDMGKVMAELKRNFAGQIDFTKAGALVKSELAS